MCGRATMYLKPHACLRTSMAGLFCSCIFPLLNLLCPANFVLPGCLAFQRAFRGNRNCMRHVFSHVFCPLNGIFGRCEQFIFWFSQGEGLALLTCTPQEDSILWITQIMRIIELMLKLSCRTCNSLSSSLPHWRMCLYWLHFHLYLKKQKCNKWV